MFGIGMPEMILILAVALIVIGPKKLPDLAKSLGKAMGEFKKATSDLKESMQIDSELKDLKSTFNDLEKEDSKAAKTASRDPEEKPVGAAEPVGAHAEASGQDDADDSMEQLKKAYGRHDADDGDIDATDSAGNDDHIDRTNGDSERGGDRDSEKSKDT